MLRVVEKMVSELPRGQIAPILGALAPAEVLGQERRRYEEVVAKLMKQWVECIDEAGWEECVEVVEAMQKLNIQVGSKKYVVMYSCIQTYLLSS